MGKQAHGIGIALKMKKVFPTATSGTNFIFQITAVPFQEVSGNSSLSGMSEWRVAHVVSQAGCGNNGTYFRKVNTSIGIFLHQSLCYIIT